MRHPFDGINPPAPEALSPCDSQPTRRSLMARLCAAAAGVLASFVGRKALAQSKGGRQGRATTFAVGEEGGRPTQPYPHVVRPTTRRWGEQGGRATTYAVGEEGGRATTFALGEEGGATTFALGEEGGHATTFALGEEGGRATTFALGEEGGATTYATGEEGGWPNSTWPW